MADIIKSLVTRIDTTANWTTLNPTPANGEQCIEVLGRGLFKLKIGDGVTPWISLNYEVLGSGFSKFKVLLDREIAERIEADDELRAAINAEVERSTTKDEELDETVGRLSVEIDSKVDKTDEASKVYGTNASGEQTVYDLDSFGLVDDVLVNGESVVEDKIARVSVPDAAEDIAYENPQYPDMHNLQDAMDKLLYVRPSVNISGGGIYELGFVKESTTLNWTWNKTIQSQGLNQGIGGLSPNVRTYVYDTPISSNTTFTITGSDGTNTASASTSVSFYNSYYFGETTTPSVTNEDILGFSSRLANVSIKTTYSFSDAEDYYVYLVFPTNLCGGIRFYQGGFETNDFLLVQRDITNSHGHTAQYNIYRFKSDSPFEGGSTATIQVQ